MSTTRSTQTRTKSAAKHPAGRMVSLKIAVRRRAKNAASKVSHWSTAQKIGAATAAVALPILAAAITTAIVKNRNKKATNGKIHRNKTKASQV